MANYITNVLTVEKGDYDLTTIKSFTDLLPIPEELKATPQDMIAYEVERIMGIGFSYGKEPKGEEAVTKAIQELYQQYSSDEEHEKLNQVILNIKNHGFASWYQWCIFNWGTKCDMRIDYSDKKVLIFDTAWCPPLEWLQEYAKTLPDGVLLQLEWADEDFGCNTGYMIASNEGVDAFEDENESQQAYDRAVEVLGEPDNLIWLDGEWTWLTEEELHKYETQGL